MMQEGSVQIRFQFVSIKAHRKRLIYGWVFYVS